MNKVEVAQLIHILTHSLTIKKVEILGDGSITLECGEVKQSFVDASDLMSWAYSMLRYQ